LLGAILDGDACSATDVLVVSALIGILEPPPAADVVDENGREVGVPVLNVSDEPLKRVPAV